jgi:hypothetical protein
MNEYFFRNYKGVEFGYLIIICYLVILILHFICRKMLPKNWGSTPKDISFDLEKIDKKRKWKLVFLIFKISSALKASGSISFMGGISGCLYAEIFNYSQYSGFFNGLIVGYAIGILYYLPNINKLHTKDVAIGGTLLFWILFVIIIVVLSMVYFIKLLF